MTDAQSYQLLQDMCRSLREDGCSTEGMYPAWLVGERRRLRKKLKSVAKAPEVSPGGRG